MEFQKCSRRLNETDNRWILLLSSMNHENKVRLFMIRFRSFYQNLNWVKAFNLEITDFISPLEQQK